jgi:hypothetical protein
MEGLTEANPKNSQKSVNREWTLINANLTTDKHR